MDNLKKIYDNSIVKLVLKILSWIVITFFVGLAIILIYHVISSKVYEIRGQKYEPYLSLYTIISPSMEPNINVYDVVLTKKVDSKTLKEGDVITFISTSTLGEGLTITHRIKNVINTDNDVKFRTQGDNNPIPDSSLVSSDHLIGKVIFKIPQLGRIQFLLQSRGGWVFVLLVPAFLVVLYDIFKVIRLSSVKQKVEDSLKEEKEDINLTNKKDLLKKKLQKKFVNVKEVDPIMSINENDKKIKANVKHSSARRVESVETMSLSKQKNIDKEKLLKEVKKISKEEEEFNADRIIDNIVSIEEKEDVVNLPKKKNKK